MWAAAHVSDVMSWQESWVHKDLHGFRQNHSANDNWWHMALQAEESLLSGPRLHDLSLDYGKCFLNLPLRQGMDLRLIRPLRSLYAGLTRRFRFGVAVGREFSSTNGVIQGCPLSVALLNLLVNV